MSNIIKAVYIEDEPNCQEDFLRTLKESCPNVEILAVCNNANKGMKAIIDYKPELVFLDVDMPNKTGIQLLEELQPLINADVLDFKVIFTTGYEKYAVQAIKLSALDYLVKPIDAEELRKAVARYSNEDSAELLKKQVETLTSNREKIILPTTVKIEGKMKRIEKVLILADILYFKASGNFTEVHFEGNKRELFCKQLGEVQNQLPDNSVFCRSEKSYIVNLAKVKAVTNCDFLLDLEGKIEVPFAPHHKAKCMAILHNL